MAGLGHHLGAHRCYVDPERTRVTVAGWAGQRLESKVDLTPTTHRCYEVSLRVHILPTWGPVRLGDITHQGVAAWVAQLSRPESGQPRYSWSASVNTRGVAA